MAAMLKKALSVVAAIAFAASVYAAGPEVRSDHPDTYVVKKGDTLWDISGMFLKNPWYWPEIWQANPQIENPHLIYPGDVISLVYIDGKPHLVVNSAEPAPDVGPKMRDEGESEPIPPLPLSAIRSFLSKPHLLSEEEYKAAPYVMAVEENRLVASDRNLIYVRQLDPNTPLGAKFAIARPTVRYSDVPRGWLWNRDERRVKSAPWSLSDQWHWSLREWVSGGEILGYESVEFGVASVARTGDPATLYVTYSDMEIRDGDLLLPLNESPFALNFYPRPPKSVPEDTFVIGTTVDTKTSGPNDVIVISKGAVDGLEVGEVYSIYQPGERVVDEIAYPTGSYRALFNPRDKMVDLPDEFIGHVMIFRTFDRVSYGLVINGVRPVYLGARLREPTQI